jgi:regulator of protease activity HflC (stomatin/prohibitin superfamily)
VIEPTEAGLYYNPNTKKLNRDSVYSSGRHAVCPGCYFFKYPTNLILFEFSGNKGSSLNCWTKDKQEITLEIFVQVSIRSEEIPLIFDKYRFDYKVVWDQKIKMAMKQTTKNYDTSQFFEERLLVTQAIKIMIESYLQPEGVDVQSVHVGQVTIPPRFEEAITTKVVTQQNAATVLMQRNVTIIESRTDIITKQAEADARVIVGEAEAEADVTMQRATAKGVAIVRQAEAKGLNDIGEELGMTVEEILELKLNRGIREMGGVDDIVVGWDDEFLSVKERT